MKKNVFYAIIMSSSLLWRLGSIDTLQWWREC